jgi:lipid-binding SYLF domain-containing protein
MQNAVGILMFPAEPRCSEGDPKMTFPRRRVISALAATAVSIPFMRATEAVAASKADIDRAVDAALKKLYANDVFAQDLSKTAKGILVFPKITKAGFVLGAAVGDGALRQGGKTVGYYDSFAASYGFQVGLQWFGYALFFMTDSALHYLDNSAGWEVGVGPSIVVVDQAMATKHTSTTLTQNVYAFIFNQKGLMAGAGIEGSKISKVG